MAHELFRLSGVPGYLLNVQADILSAMATTVVVPLLPADDVAVLMAQLNPVFDIEGRRYAMVTQAIASATRKELGVPVGRLGDEKHHIITQALDMLFTGF